MSPFKSAVRPLPWTRGLAVLVWLLAVAVPSRAADTGAAVAVAVAAPASAALPRGGSAITAVRLLPGEHLRLDGTLSHPAWARAPVFADFVEKTPNTGAVPLHPTRVRVLFNRQAIYVGVEAIDPDPSLIRAPLVRHDGVNRTQDFVVLYLDAIGSRQSAQFFRVNAAGSLADGMHTASDDSEDFAPDFDFDAATARNPQGYSAVFRIPFASLRFASDSPEAGRDRGDNASQPWRIMVARRVPREQFYLYSSVLIPRDAPSFIAALQPLEGVTLPEQQQFLTLRPSLTWRRLHDQAAGAPGSRSSQVAATLDLKWRPVAELVIDATLNPDFSQVALDVPQLAGNTKFALEFPEKRPFFFESSDLLRSPTAALYSRSFTEPRWGLRSTWRGARLAASAYAIDDRGGGAVLLPGTYGTDSVAQPASKALVARIRSDSGTLQLGAVATARRYAGDRGDNQVLGPDLAWQIDSAWRLRAQWLQSVTTAQSLAGGLARGADSRGQMGYARLWYQSPQLEGDLSASQTGAGFRNDSGFVVQNGVRRLAGRVARGWQSLGPFNEFWLNLEGETVQDAANGQTVSQDLSPGIWLTGAHNLEAWAYWHGGHGTAALRTAAGNPLLQQNYLKAGVTLTPALAMPLLNAELQFGQLADVAANRVRPGGKASLSFNTRPLARLELEPSLVYAWLNQDGRRVYGEAAHQVLARWHFTARQSLRAIVQYTTLDRLAESAAAGRPALAPQHSSGSTGSLTYAWRESAGTVLYVGASRSRQGLGLGGLPASSAVSHGNEVFIKLQVDADEARRWF